MATSKWVKEIHEAFYSTNEMGDLDAVDEILDRIDALLFRAMLSVDDINLSNEIEEELNGTN